MKTAYRVLIACASLAVSSELLYHGWKRIRPKKLEGKKKWKSKKFEVNEVIMFRPHESGSGLQRSTFSRCLISPQLDRIMFHLTSARSSIDIAIYVMTSIDLGNILAHLLKTGVMIRIIVDADMHYSTGSQIRRLEEAGAQVRWLKSPNLMHHKFCLIDALNGGDRNGQHKTRSGSSGDRPARLLTGSLNWTTQALNGNWENVVVTTQEQLVAEYKLEFDSLWKEFSNKMECAASNIL